MGNEWGEVKGREREGVGRGEGEGIAGKTRPVTSRQRNSLTDSNLMI